MITEGDGPVISVSIAINASPIFTRSAVNRGENDLRRKGYSAYEVDTGEVIYHKRSAGAVKLAKKLLDTIKEQE